MITVEKQNNGIRLERIKCPACDGLEFALCFRARDLRLKTCAETFDIVKCAGCGLIFVNPQPIKSEAVKFYTADFNREGATWLHKILSVSLAPIENQMIKTLIGYKKCGKLLDIGCGSGRFMSVMQKKGFDVWGCELNVNSKDFALASLNGRIYYKELIECNFPEKSFDLITMFQSLEHMHGLDSLFKEIRRIIKDDGVIYVYVPNMDFFEARLFGPYYYNLEVPRHLYCFTRASISKLLAKYGFKVDRFFKNHILELAATPTSFHYSLWSWLEDKGMLKSVLLRRITLLPFVIVRLVLRLFFIFNEQNLKVASFKV